MNLKIKILFFIAIFNLSFINNSFNKKEFYDAFASSSLEEVNSMLSKLENKKTSSLFRAYKGALFMKQSSLLKTPLQKLDVFKKGMQILESEINKFPKNVEYRFLRLSIQENAPKFLNYYKDIENDKEIITKNYKILDEEMKNIIRGYSKKSKILKTSKLQY